MRRTPACRLHQVTVARLCSVGSYSAATLSTSCSSSGTGASPHAFAKRCEHAYPGHSHEPREAAAPVSCQARQSRWRRCWKVARTSLGVAVVGGLLVLAPPKETLPASLLQTRVLLEGIGRVGRCGKVGVQILIDYQMSLRGEAALDQKEWNTVHRRSAQRLVSLAEVNGGLYVKAGQIFASMSHILPPEYTRTMAVLQDAVIKRPYQEIVAVIERDFNASVDSLFSFLDPTPIAAASLAQVHRGTLREGSRDVAVKVQYIDVAQRFTGDMRTIQLMLNIVGYLYPGYDLSEIVMKLNDTVAAELDFCTEGRNCDRAARDLRPIFGNRVVTPEVHWKYTTPRVLTTSFVADAVKASDREGMERLNIDVAVVATSLYDALAYQMFQTGFIHGDPHAGNILVHKLPNGQPQVVLLDFGLCTDMSNRERHQLAEIWTASVTHDSETLQRIAQNLHGVDYKMLASCFLQHPYDFFTTSGRSETEESREMMRNQMKEKMMEVNDVIVTLPKEYALVLRNMLAVKAIGKELGEPVNRPLRMLRYSVLESHKNASWIQFYRILWRAWWEDLKASVILAYAKWRHPEAMELIEASVGGGNAVAL